MVFSLMEFFCPTVAKRLFTKTPFMPLDRRIPLGEFVNDHGLA